MLTDMESVQAYELAHPKEMDLEVGDVPMDEDKRPQHLWSFKTHPRRALQNEGVEQKAPVVVGRKLLDSPHRCSRLSRRLRYDTFGMQRCIASGMKNTSFFNNPWGRWLLWLLAVHGPTGYFKTRDNEDASKGNCQRNRLPFKGNTRMYHAEPQKMWPGEESLRNYKAVE